MSSEKFCLRWNDFEENISNAFKDIRAEKDFFDVTIACEDDQLMAHKVILSACSPFFKNVLRRNQHQHPLLYLKGVSVRDMEALLNFMYHGKVNVAQGDLNSFLQVAEDLKVKGKLLIFPLWESHLTDIALGLAQYNPGSVPQIKERNLSRSQQSEYETTPAAKRPRPSPFTPRVNHQPGAEGDDDIEVIVPGVKFEPLTDPLPTVMRDPIQSEVQPVEQNMAVYDEYQMQGSMMESLRDWGDYERQSGVHGYNTNMIRIQDTFGAGRIFVWVGHCGPKSITRDCPFYSKRKSRNIRNICKSFQFQIKKYVIYIKKNHIWEKPDIFPENDNQKNCGPRRNVRASKSGYMCGTNGFVCPWNDVQWIGWKNKIRPDVLDS